MRPSRHPILRLVLFGLGIVLIIVSPLVGAIPGPGGIFVFAAGLALMLQNSRWAKRQFARLKRRWPKFGHAADWGLRRPSARRRRERDKPRDLVERAENGRGPPEAVPLRVPSSRDEM